MELPVSIVIPFRINGAKSRLSAVLSAEERHLLALSMLNDVLKVASGEGKIIILSRPDFDKCLAIPRVKILYSGLDLNDALNEQIEKQSDKGWPENFLIIMADLPLLAQGDVQGIIRTEGDVVFSPGRGAGTNMILIRDPRFRTYYNGLSFPKHLESARQRGLRIGIYTSYGSMCDIDTPSDIPEILLHGKGMTKSLLESLGFVSKKRGTI
ncbi:MAG: 2-phospho-L-lactate guanylyltransferase [Methanotrichaceae archaeon]|nr:2-phospho-L-lactate guanylyltransferase [Methanotrichaceae archaeon]